ncbi:DUF1684 domain-containing protein [Natronobiforma cellulositropha]|uniref:DUF1684 domain-containing protein n=1 Tax=Natronobiforma cellulositropha TaxID=1679076 RepID=UPI0021D5D7D4|nr:DUF1684 domain-containing protein [Natronobiforma cellulositropha]
MTDAFDAERWRAELEAKRTEKDEFFAEHPQSPVPPGEREEFEGVAYFEPDPAYRVSAAVDRDVDPEEPVLMETTAGREVRYVRASRLAFEVPSSTGERRSLTLTAYHQDERDRTLFVPFRDKTTGQQTYAGGRYMELTVEGDLTDGAELVLDFNLAYTPFCAYSETFDCPLPPEENWLEVAIAAGERLERA